ncbi:hypothetical protein G7B40_006435 [Aetokthonos hydrillicola Thurmond2011]|jgi:hypothetical protein|uniref:Uncharacterized protein n=1 Tax=Aetokthonos hydrillicola Thurmond2011 TaxID=2712845 RepID=A0AAP5I830_9CYAN|nr:hypothetical protein [Aetokthonos hydrillicola]MBO3458586.1 hypothetical protein [Aetokthonos hydrillicola CCALA 1050]MBW4585029.1 hypothetical protein [Aetokthonos hydrillicola CCALA 1050]MDR9894210.1 hypothetical protein [Aetokthonos hydrillicola Thurmond2011]
MSPLQIEQRLSNLEAEVSQIKQALLNSAIPTKPWWEDITGIFADDPAFEEAMALGREYRQSSGIEAETPNA